MPREIWLQMTWRGSPPFVEWAEGSGLSDSIACGLKIATGSPKSEKIFSCGSGRIFSVLRGSAGCSGNSTMHSKSPAKSDAAEPIGDLFPSVAHDV